jgi:hypothetical protein
MLRLWAVWNQVEPRISNWASIVSCLMAFLAWLIPVSLMAQSVREAIYVAGFVLTWLASLMLFLLAVMRGGRKALHAEAGSCVREAVLRGPNKVDLGRAGSSR